MCTYKCAHMTGVLPVSIDLHETSSQRNCEANSAHYYMKVYIEMAQELRNLSVIADNMKCGHMTGVLPVSIDLHETSSQRNCEANSAHYYMKVYIEMAQELRNLSVIADNMKCGHMTGVLPVSIDLHETSSQRNCEANSAHYYINVYIEVAQELRDLSVIADNMKCGHMTGVLPVSIDLHETSSQRNCEANSAHYYINVYIEVAQELRDLSVIADNMKCVLTSVHT
ncbi:hypothetical protein J6590_012479 [Homalodisca vitripennis]|nr:hypothetical protein J6590_012479 [Homalodisca vitripennis]